MARIVIDLSRDLPPRATPPTEEALTGVFGGFGGFGPCQGEGAPCGIGGAGVSRSCCAGLRCDYGATHTGRCVK